jgi:hypothetical protein
MLTATPTDRPTFPARPDVSETFARTVDSPLPAVEASVARVDLIGPLVDGLIAIGIGDHILTPCPNGLVWRFDGSGYGRVRLAWALEAEAETDDASLVTLSVRLSASDDAARERLLEAWPVLGPIVELHARRVLHAVEELAEDAEDDPFDGPGLHAPRLRVVRPEGRLAQTR